MKRHTFSLCLTLFTTLILTASGPAYSDSAFPVDAPENQGVATKALDALAEVARLQVEKDHLVGAELLVIKNRRTVLHETFGYRDREDGLAWEENTICNIRSMTKTFTGAAAQLLIDRGELKLDDRVAQYIPGFDTDEAREITIDQIMSHRAGLPLSILTAIDEYPDLHMMANAVGERGPEFEPGSRFWYSDSGTDVLGAVVEVVSGQLLNEFIETNLLTPLGMADTFYVSDMTDPRVERIAGLYFGGVGAWSKGWEPGGEPFYPFAWGSQTLYSTPMDYAKFLAMWMDQGRVGEDQLLSREAVARTLEPISEMTSLGSDMRSPTFFPDLETYYGRMSQLWLPADAAEGETPVVIGHGGSDGTMAWVWPELDLMVLYFTQSRGSLSVLRIEEDIDRLLIHPDRVVRTAEVPDEYKPYLGTYVANFASFRDVEFTVLVHNGRLALDVPGQLVFDLHNPDDEGKWYFVMTDQVAVSFDTGEGGDVTGLKMYEAGQTFELPKGKAERKPEPMIDLAQVKEYVGTYLVEETGEHVQMLIHDGRLAVKTPDVMMPLDLYPPDESGLWSLRVNQSVKIRFDEDENGQVVSFTAIMPDGTELVRTRVDEVDESSGENASDE
ncbi:MAG: beta-lactamase family protein [Phycisphaerales bacterium]|nr:beta-lactamase family protein [Phycisphaerales bacterium]